MGKSSDIETKLRELTKLWEQGLITRSDYSTAKKELLASFTAAETETQSAKPNPDSVKSASESAAHQKSFVNDIPSEEVSEELQAAIRKAKASMWFSIFAILFSVSPIINIPCSITALVLSSKSIQVLQENPNRKFALAGRIISITALGLLLLVAGRTFGLY